jgi:hypothetical protein
VGQVLRVIAESIDFDQNGCVAGLITRILEAQGVTIEESVHETDNPSTINEDVHTEKLMQDI